MKRKRAAKKRVNPKRLIHTVNEIFNNTLKKPALKNTILVVIAIALSKTLRINEIALHLPVAKDEAEAAAEIPQIQVSNPIGHGGVGAVRPADGRLPRQREIADSH